jgi:hypothetical protein
LTKLTGETNNIQNNSKEIRYKKMGTLPIEFKKKVADMYLSNREELEKLDPTTMELFASQVLEIVNKEKKKTDALHDLEILEYNIGLFKNYSTALKGYEKETDEYDFTQNDCKNLMDSTKKWLKLEGLL